MKGSISVFNIVDEDVVAKVFRQLFNTIGSDLTLLEGEVLVDPEAAFNHLVEGEVEFGV